ncbi:MAG: hypothetical protein K8R92_01035 [Planctomycetes bacterium]|nr:hypothetical protein [Planctomycetota bacterium]
MRWFDLFFPVAMIAFPLVFVLCSPRGPADAVTTDSLARARGLALALLVATIICLGGHLLLWLGHVRFLFIDFCFFFPLWFGIAMPALAARNPDLAHAHPVGSTVRRASLVPRDQSPLAPRSLWTLSIALGAACLLGIALRPWSASFAAFFEAIGLPGPGPFDEAAQSLWLKALAIQVTLLTLTFTVLHGSLGMLRREPEPLDARSSPELVRSYAALRQFKAHAMMLLFGVGGNLFFGLAMVALAWVAPGSREQTMVLAIGGATAGSLLGIGGGIIGTVASMRRARINALIRSLDNG